MTGRNRWVLALVVLQFVSGCCCWWPCHRFRPMFGCGGCGGCGGCMGGGYPTSFSSPGPMLGAPMPIMGGPAFDAPVMMAPPAPVPAQPIPPITQGNPPPAFTTGQRR